MAPPPSAAGNEGRPVEAWLEVAGTPDSSVQLVIEGLRANGARLRRGERRRDGQRNGVLVFSDDAGAVAERLRKLTSGGSDRVLALCIAGRELGGDTWELLRAGASDVFSWSAEADAARHVAERLRRWQAIDELVACPHVREFLVGESRAWRAVVRDAAEVARFTHASVLITGESGTGKERLAQLIHELDPRPGKREMVVLDCSTVVPSLSGSEFFGHEKGAFTGAAAARAGAFELADGGTLFLDEVGELAVPLQAELLRVIQEGTFKRVGSNTWRKSSFRLICATNRDLAAEQANGNLRNDFFYRIAGGSRLHLPSLRERPDDILPLFRHFFGEAQPGQDQPELEGAVHDLLVNRSYPGNVRDLRSLTLRIGHRYLGAGLVTVGDIPEDEWPAPRERGAGPVSRAAPRRRSGGATGVASSGRRA